MYVIRAQEEEREGNRGAEMGEVSLCFSVCRLLACGRLCWGEQLSPFQGHRERQIEVEGGELECYNTLQQLNMATLPKERMWKVQPGMEQEKERVVGHVA